MSTQREDQPARDNLVNSLPATPRSSPHNLFNQTFEHLAEARNFFAPEGERDQISLVGLFADLNQTDSFERAGRRAGGEEGGDGREKVYGRDNVVARPIEVPLDRTVNNRNGSSVKWQDGAIVGLSPSQGAAVEFSRNPSGNLEKIAVDGGKKEISKGEGGRWYLKQKDAEGKDEQIELKEQPAIYRDGSFSIVTKAGTKQTFKTDGSVVHTNAAGKLVQVDYADGGKTTIEWKGEGKNAKENIIRKFRPDGSRAEQIQLNDQGKYDKFTWAQGAAANQYTHEGALEAIGTYKDGEIYTRTPGERGWYENTDRTKVQLDNSERVTKISYTNGEVREFGYFDKGNEVKWAKLPNGSYLSRDSKDADFNFIRTDELGREAKTPANLELKVENGIYSWRRTDGSDPHIHTYLNNGKEMLETAGGGKAVSDAEGKVQKYVYPLNGREVAVDAQGKPTRITEKDGRSWTLTDAAKNEWTSGAGVKRELTVKDGVYSYKDEGKIEHIFGRDGIEEQRKPDGTSITLRGDKITSATGTDGKTVQYRYREDGVSTVTDANGYVWQRNVGTNEWIRTRDNKEETLKGSLKVNGDGSFTFEGTKDGKDLKVVRKLDGTQTDATASHTQILKRDGSATSITFEGEGDKGAIKSIVRLDKDGKEAFRYDRQPGAGGIESSWKSEKRGDFKGEIEVTARGDLLFKKANADKSISTLDEKRRTVELQMPDGKIRKFEYDARDNLNAELEFKNKDDRNPIAWKREGSSDIWKSNEGSIWSGKNRLDAASGVKWERKAGSEDEWNVTRGGKTETLKGSLKVGTDGTYSFEGTRGDTKVNIDYKAAGNFIDRRGDETNVYYPDGSRTKISYEGEGDKRMATHITRYGKDGNAHYSYDRKAEGDPLQSTWKSEKKGDYQGDILINDNGELIFSKQNADKTVAGTDEKDRLRERTYTDGTIRKFDYDDNGDLRRLTRYLNKDDKKPIVWTKQGNTDFWTSSEGVVWEAKFEVKDGKFSIKDETGRKTKRSDGTEEVDASDKLTVARDIKKQEENILEMVSSKLSDDKDLERFKKDLKDFEKRARDFGLSDGEVAKTFRELTRMLVTPGDQPVSPSDRLKATLHAMSHFADPTSVDQGWHNTCNVTTVESTMCTKEPAAVAKLLADVSTTGKFTTADGTEIALDPKSLKPDKEADTRFPEDWKRSFASQLFQITACNVHWQRQTTMPDGTVAGKGKIQYTQITGPKAFVGDTRERLIDTNTGNACMMTDSAGVRRQEDSPYLSPVPLPDIYQQIAGRRPDCLVVASSLNPGVLGAGIETVDSVDAFHAKLTQLATNKDRDAEGNNLPRLPIILCVHTSKPPFTNSADQGGAGGEKGGYHVVTITGYDPKTGMVSMDNQWGRRWDHLGRADGKERIQIRDLYPALYK